MNTVSTAACSMGACIHILDMEYVTSTQSHDAATDDVTWNHASNLVPDTHGRLCLSFLKGWKWICDIKATTLNENLLM